jgi:hypothetical protein
MKTGIGRATARFMKELQKLSPENEISALAAEVSSSVCDEHAALARFTAKRADAGPLAIRDPIVAWWRDPVGQVAGQIRQQCPRTLRMQRWCCSAWRGKPCRVRFAAGRTAARLAIGGLTQG